jgi:hypothetical protein
MGAGIIAKLALHFGMPERGVKIALIGLAIIVAVISLGIAKCTYDRGVVDKASSKQAAANARADRKADAGAAVQRRSDDARLAQESQQLGKAQSHAQTDLDRRLARARCVRAQQAARANGGQPPACA